MVHFPLIPLRHRLARRRLHAALLIGLCCSVVTAHAQPGVNASRPDPLDPNAGVPALIVESSLARYRRLDDARPIPWREANDTVARIGGWRVYAREARQPDAAPGVKRAPQAPPAQNATPEGATQPLPIPRGHDGPKAP